MQGTRGILPSCPDEPAERWQLLDELKDVFRSTSATKVGHGLKSDLATLKWNEFEIDGPLVDTWLVHLMTEPEMPHGLAALSSLYLNYRPQDGIESTEIADRTNDQLMQRACERVDITLQVHEKLRPMVSERGADQVCYQVECPLIPALLSMEHNGITLDAEAIGDYSKVLQSEIDQLTERIFEAAGHEFNIDSPKQLGVVLYEELELEKKPKKTSTGQYSTRETELERLASKHPIVADVLDYRNATKLKATYVDQLPHSVTAETGRLHTHYSQTWTSTGRLQSNAPNLQTIPVRKERGREIRAAFVPRGEEYLILSADYSQIELRIMAELSNDESMVKAFTNDEDIHSVTASKVFKVDPEDVTREMRSKAKMVNFGIIYGISGFGLQQRLNIPRAEANSLIENYFDKYPGVTKYIDETVAFAKKHGYVRTMTGRRRYIREINSRSRTAANTAERLAMNSPIQGTAADMLKLAMVRVHAALQTGGYRTKMLLTVHDELVFDLHQEEADEVMPLIQTEMKNALPMQVPIVVEMGTGKNWLDAH